jgi:hypothetical protein
VGLSRLSTTLVPRLVLNLRERALSQLPTTVETERRFQAALPVARQPVTLVSVRNPSSARPNRSTMTGETLAGVAVGESSSQPRSADPIGYETERSFQAALPIARQPVTSVRTPKPVLSQTKQIDR